MWPDVTRAMPPAFAPLWTDRYGGSRNDGGKSIRMEHLCRQAPYPHLYESFFSERAVVAKSPRVYLLILSLWIAVLIPALPAMAHVVSAAIRTHWYLGALTIASALFVTYFWLNGTKDIVYTLYFHLVQRPRPHEVPRRAATGAA